MEFSSSDIPSMGCKKKCNDTCQCSSIAQLFGGLWDTSKGRNSALNSLDNKLASWGCKNSSCCAISSLYAASTFGFKIDELVYSTNVNAIYEALETITGIEQIDIEPNTLVVTIKGAAGILGSALNMLLGMGYSVSKIILDEKKPPKTTKMGEIEMEERGIDAKKKKTGKKGKKGKLISSSEDVPLLSSVVVDETEPDLKLHFKVGGMTCGSCVGMITHSVLSLPLVRSCDVNLLAQEMIVRFPSDVETSIVSKDVVSAVEDLGFTAEEMKKKLATKDPITTISLNISGMTCSSCVGMIENCLMNTKGVSIASVNLLSNLATVTFDETVTGARDLIESVSELGFGASLRSEHEQTDLKDSLTRKSEIESWRKKFFISLVFTLPIILITMVFMYIPGIKHLLHVNVFVPRLPLESVLSALLATPVQFYCCWEFYIKAWKSLKARAANMEVLVSMGSSVAYAYSLFSIIKHALDPKFAGHHFFETSAALICFVLLGRLLENIAKGKTSQALVRLMDLKPKTALLVKDFRSSSQLEEEIHSDLIQMGDILKVIPGSSVPADGTVVSGYSSVNESMITGEAASVFKEVGSQVVGGTINNEGLLFIKASRVGANSTLSQIVQLVEEAQTSKPPIQAFADKITGYFVPTVVCIAVVTWLVWFLLGIADAYPAEWRNGSDPFLFSLMFGISVLVISCPCALGLATPTAVMVGTGVGAKLGLLIKGGQPLEMAQKVNTFLFDKTGTLTVGNLQVTDFIVVNANGEEVDKASSQQKEFLLCLGSAESASEHPIGKAIVKYCKEILGTQLPSPIHFVTTAGKGLSCQVDDKKVVVGNRSFIQNCVRENQEEAKTIPTSLLTRADGLEEQGKTCIFVALDGVAAGLVALSDVLKPEARAVIKFLREQGNEIYMVTGDNHRVARHVGRQLGLEGEHVISEVIPKEKGDMVKLLQSKGKTVAFVGDGINDSVALSQADLGIALGSGTDVAMECADVVVMGTGLQGVGTAVELARTTYRRMRLNMLWALLYNSLAIPLAAGLFFPLTHSSLPPMFAGFAMAISSVSVVVSSLMLRLYKPRDFGVQDAN